MTTPSDLCTLLGDDRESNDLRLLQDRATFARSWTMIGGAHTRLREMDLHYTTWLCPVSILVFMLLEQAKRQHSDLTIE